MVFITTAVARSEFKPYPGLEYLLWVINSANSFQQLELKHVDNKGCFGAMEFR